MNSNGQMIMVNLLVLVMTIAIMIALLPMLTTVLNIGKQSDNLNCNGYKYNGDATNPLSYNSSLNTNSLACTALDFYVPYLVLAILIGGMTRVLAGRMAGGGDVYY